MTREERLLLALSELDENIIAEAATPYKEKGILPAWLSKAVAIVLIVSCFGIGIRLLSEMIGSGGDFDEGYGESSPADPGVSDGAPSAPEDGGMPSEPDYDGWKPEDDTWDTQEPKPDKGEDLPDNSEDNDPQNSN